jgi:GTP 3',8-cyclase
VIPLSHFLDSFDKNAADAKPSFSDSFGRVAKKLRISVTDRCNLRCIYCMPADNTKWFDHSEILTFEEIERVVRIFVRLGVQEIKITGGEPLVRSNIEDLIAKLSRIDGLKSIGLTTNGILLSEKSSLLKKAGLSSVNISLDTFKPETFKTMNGADAIDKVLDSIDAASKAGLKVKINTVIMKGLNDDEILDFANFARDTGKIVRFIEFMPLDGAGIWRKELVVTKKEILDTINNNLMQLVQLSHDNSEPAMLYSFQDGKGVIGFIPSITEPFCQKCDRVRITSDGRFLTCLFENPGYDIKKLLRTGNSDEQIANHLFEAMKKKPEGIIKIIKTNQLKPTLNLMHTIGG